MNKKEPLPVMYIFVNADLGMSPGKLAAQACHASCLSQRGSKPEMVEEFYKYGFYMKLIMRARNAEHIRTIEKYLADRNIKSFTIIDEGHTEIEPHQITALGVEIVDKSEVGPIFEEFELYKPELTLKIRWNDE